MLLCILLGIKFVENQNKYMFLGSLFFFSFESQDTVTFFSLSAFFFIAMTVSERKKNQDLYAFLRIELGQRAEQWDIWDS